MSSRNLAWRSKARSNGETFKLSPGFAHGGIMFVEFELLAPYSMRLRQFRGKVKFSRTLSDLKADR